MMDGGRFVERKIAESIERRTALGSFSSPRRTGNHRAKPPALPRDHRGGRSAGLPDRWAVCDDANPPCGGRAAYEVYQVRWAVLSACSAKGPGAVETRGRRADDSDADQTRNAPGLTGGRRPVGDGRGGWLKVGLKSCCWRSSARSWPRTTGNSARASDLSRMDLPAGVPRGRHVIATGEGAGLRTR